MATRARMRLQSMTEKDWGGSAKSVELHFQCQYDSRIPEDLKFQKATPSGNATFQIDNPAALEQFIGKVGKTFYFDITEAAE